MNRAGALSDAVRAFAELGEPVSLTLSQLRRQQLRFDPAHPAVLVCQDPTEMDEAKQRAGIDQAIAICSALLAAGHKNVGAPSLTQ